jgi:hypothetical protein
MANMQQEYTILSIDADDDRKAIVDLEFPCGFIECICVFIYVCIYLYVCIYVYIQLLFCNISPHYTQ